MAITALVTERLRYNASLFLQSAPTERNNDLNILRMGLWDDIREQLLNGQLVARGIPDGHRISENIDPHFFSEVTVDFREGSVTLGSFKFVGVRITRAQQKAAAERATTSSAITPEIWMDKVTEPGLIKREDALARCREETKCTYRAARAAWDGLPAGRKRARGERGKSDR